MQSAIGEGMTRKDHSDVSNQVWFCLLTTLLFFLFINHLIGVILFLLSSMQIMPLERMSRQWKPWSEKKHFHLRTWSLLLFSWEFLFECSEIVLEVVVLIKFILYDQQLYLEFLEKFERKFVAQGAYDTRNIFQSLDLAWTLLRIFPRELLHRIPAKTLDQFYSRDASNWGYNNSKVL